MMTTHYKNKEGQDVTSSVYVDFHKKLDSGDLRITRLLALLLTVAADDSEFGRSVFSSILTQFAIYMCCDGVMNIHAPDGWYDHLAAANSELLALLNPSNKEFEGLDATPTYVPKGGHDI